MKTLGIVLTLILAAVPAWAADELKIDVVAGGQAVDTGSELDAWYHRYAFNPDGVILPLIRMRHGATDQPLFVDLKGTWVLRDDQSFTGLFDHPGVGRLLLFYDQTPFWQYRNSTVLWNEQEGVLSIDPSIRAVLEAAAFGPSPTTDLPPLVDQALATTAHDSHLMTRRDLAGFQGDTRLAKNWRLAASFGHRQREGDRLVAAGTYVRIAPNDSTFDRETFDVRGSDLLEPVDYRTWLGSLSTDVRGRKGFLEAGFHVSFFRNDQQALLWNNPFEAPPSERTIDGQSQANRGRFASGQMALPPDNDFLRGHLSGMYRLSSRARVTATAAMSRMTQDVAFLPFTVNEAIFFPGPDSVLGTPDDVAGTDRSLLPAKSLDGEISTTRLDLRLSTSPVDRLSVDLTGRYYEYEDKTPRLEFPGYAAFGESAFRRGIGQTESGLPALFNEPASYDQTRAGLTASWAIRIPYRLTAGYERVMTDYVHRPVEGTNEDIVTAMLRGSNGPLDWRAFGEIGRRTHEGEYEIGLETSRLRQYDVWDRDRNRFGAELDAELSPGFIVGLAGSMSEVEYPGKVEGAPHPYGLQDVQRDEVSLSLDGRPGGSRWGMSAAVGYEKADFRNLTVTKTSWDAATLYDPVNRWERNQDDKTFWGNLELRADLVPDRWTTWIGYNLTLYRGEVLTTNPELTDRTTNTAYAVDWSELKTTAHEVNVSLDHWFQPGFGLGLRYAFAPFRIDDPAWNTLEPTMQGRITEVGSSPANIRPMNAARTLFLNSRYDDMDTHVIALVVTAALR